MDGPGHRSCEIPVMPTMYRLPLFSVVHKASIGRRRTGLDCTGALKMLDVKITDVKLTDQITDF